MPLYEYLCDGCGRQSELLVAADARPDCPECGSSSMRKLLSRVAAPSREASNGQQGKSAPGPCGAHCGCHPRPH